MLLSTIRLAGPLESRTLAPKLLPRPTLDDQGDCCVLRRKIESGALCERRIEALGARKPELVVPRKTRHGMTRRPMD
jgi:hypothetical protein